MSQTTSKSRLKAWGPIVFPAHALLIVEERLREQEAEGVLIPKGMPLDELALQVLIAASVPSPPRRGPPARWSPLPQQGGRSG